MLNLAALNSATKYPSIETYHALGDRGSLTETVTPFHGDVILTEKIDGTNSRIILAPDGDWFIGTAEPGGFLAETIPSMPALAAA